MDRPALGNLDVAQLVHGLADDVDHAAEGGLADRHRDRLAGVLRAHAAHHAVGRLHGDRADAVFAEVLLHLADDVHRNAGLLARVDDAHRVVDRRQVALVELDVDDRTDDLNDFPDIGHSDLRYSNAAAPDTTSMIAVVIEAWRTRFMWRVRASVSSFAFFVAAVHRRHARGVLGGGGFQQGPPDLHAHVAGKDRLEQRLRLRLVDVVLASPAADQLRPGNRQDLLDDRSLATRRS